MFRNKVPDNTAESCIEILSGVHPTHDYNGADVHDSDKHLINSLTKQSFKGVAYTDRQYELVKSKISLYKDVLEKLEIDVDECINNLRLELRTIDRSKWIGVRNVNGTNYLAVRFTFNKRLISAIESLRASGIEKEKINDTDNKINYFKLTEKNIYKIIEILKERKFTIEDEVNLQYEKMQVMMNNKNNYVPGVYGFKLKNLNKKAVDYIISDIGDQPSPKNLALYKDREALYGIEHFDQEDLDASVKHLTTLSQRIVRRTSTQILINPESFTVDHIAESILELNRYPLLVCLDNNEQELDYLTKVYKSFRNIFLNEDFCVLYRKDNDTQENKDFNQFIKQNYLNNSLGNSSKIVYTTQDKLIKTLIKQDWHPKSALVFGCSRKSKIQTYLNELDLVMYYDTDVSPFLTNKIEKI